MYNSKIYKRIKEAVESNMIATIQQDLSGGKTPFKEQVANERWFNLGVIAGAGACDTLYGKEMATLNKSVERLAKYKCEWSKYK